MIILGFDTETTGLPVWSTPSDDSRQPHLIQLAAILYDDAGRRIDHISTIVKPGAGARMEPEAFAAHGISLAMAEAEGMDCLKVLDRFHEMASVATLIVGHNISFDVRIMRIAFARHRGFKWEAPCPTFCTMKRSSSIVNLPPTERMVRAGRNWPKPPKLIECMKHFFDEGLDGAHDALVDVEACMRVYFHLTQKLGIPVPKPEPVTAAPVAA
jgi:DNA polymerase-3 subunit epsilon